LHVVLLALLLATLIGGGILLSVAESTTLVDGAREWREDSALRAVVRLLCLDYHFPTVYADEIKNYILGVGAALGALALGIALAARPRNETISDSISPVEEADPRESSGPAPAAPARVHVTPYVAAQLLVGFFLLWSLAGSRWSAAPELAVGGTLQLAFFYLWSLGLAHGLNRKAARTGSYALVAVTVLISLIAVWYYYGRNPVIRAKFPFGNPSFLAAALLPGMLLAVSLGCGVLRGIREHRPSRFVLLILLLISALGVSAWAFALADSRGALLGLGAGILAVAFFAFHGRRKAIPIVLALVLILPLWSYYAQEKSTDSPTGRSETIRFREYAWSYAWRMFLEKPFTGHGQGGFALGGDAFAMEDVLNDPKVFEARISHAHCEWLEVLSDLGTVGFVLIAGALILTVRAGMQSLSTSASKPDRWPLIGLLAGLVALSVEECFGVGLRVAGVPTFFYTVLGLIWAFSIDGVSPLWTAFKSSAPRRAAAGIVGGLVCLVVLLVNQADFTDARNAHRVSESLRREEFDEAVRLASLATNRLNPQRALEGYFHLGEAHMLIARRLQSRAADREARARQGPTPDPAMLELARQDRIASDEHCRLGSGAVRELVRRCPVFLNQGWVTYWLNIVQAGNAEARGDQQQREQFLATAAGDLERELRRQPFDPALATQYVQIAWGTADVGPLLDVLARPLRYHRLTGIYLNLLRDLSGDASFSEQLALLSRPAATPKPDWVPEKLRLLAAYHFMRGDYGTAKSAAEQAVREYETLNLGPELGVAAGLAEWAECRFVGDPRDAEAAVNGAERAISLAPQSEPGRAFQAIVKQRLVEYHLALGREDTALTYLRETGPAWATQDVLLRELGSRYRQLVQSLMLYRRENLLLPKPVNDWIPQLQQWIARAVELNPDDYVAHFLCADLAFHRGDDVAAAASLRTALERGLPPAEAHQFLSLTLEKRPDSAPLQELWNALLASQEPSSERIESNQQPRGPAIPKP
jgi:O-antigen ligase/tetratricopeptide (TPR) repeat protein